MNAEPALDIVRRAIEQRVFPAAAAAAGLSDGFLFSEVFGTRTFDETAPVVHEIGFDLASLTKPIATTTVVLQLIDGGMLRLDTRVAELSDDWRGADREHVTVQDLLEHTSGLPARLVDAPPLTRREFEHDICSLPLEYEPRSRSLYSDLDFILLGLVAERCGSAPLAAQFRDVLSVLSDVEETLSYSDEPLEFTPNVSNTEWFAPTLPEKEDPRRGRRLAGEVHDHYAAALGGVAGHAGLFGTIESVSAFARLVLRAARGDRAIPAPLSPALVARAIRRSQVPASSRALGWDTMLPTSSCGTHMSASAVGHVGFTGTSLWIDPVRDRYFVLLTNRACGGGTVEQMREVRRAFHDALGDV